MKYNKLSIEYIIEDEPLGTGGAIREALKYVMGENVVVLNGETLFAVDLNKMANVYIP